jgi:hypothetical protein
MQVAAARHEQAFRYAVVRLEHRVVLVLVTRRVRRAQCRMQVAAILGQAGAALVRPDGVGLPGIVPVKDLVQRRLPLHQTAS